MTGPRRFGVDRAQGAANAATGSMVIDEQLIPFATTLALLIVDRSGVVPADEE